MLAGTKIHALLHPIAPPGASSGEWGIDAFKAAWRSERRLVQLGVQPQHRPNNETFVGAWTRVERVRSAAREDAGRLGKVGGGTLDDGGDGAGDGEGELAQRLGLGGGVPPARRRGVGSSGPEVRRRTRIL